MSGTANAGSVLVEFLGKADNLINEIGKAGKGLEDFGKKSQAAGLAISAGLSAPLAAMVGFSVKAASDFQSAFAGVRKTVDGDTSAIEAGIRKMSKAMPVAADELSKIAANAGQLGVKKADILAFTETIARLGVSTNLSTEEAAVSLARFQNITTSGKESVAQLGSAIVFLGNNFATTESEVVNMAMRIAKAGETAGLSRTEILGLAASLSSVGIEAEAGGSAVSKILIEMQVASRKGGADLKAYADIAGMTSTAFKNMALNSPAAALQELFKGLKGIKDQGGDVFAALSKIGIEEVRTRDAALGLANASEMVGRAMRGAGEAAQANTALMKESETRFATFESQLKTAWGVVKDLGVSIGNELLPTLTELVKGFIAFAPTLELWVKDFAALPQPVKIVAAALVGIGIALGPALLLLGQFAQGLVAIGALLGPAALATTGFGATLLGGSGAIAAIGALTTALTVLSGVGVLLFTGGMIAWFHSLQLEIWGAEDALKKTNAEIVRTQGIRNDNMAKAMGGHSTTSAGGLLDYHPAGGGKFQMAPNAGPAALPKLIDPEVAKKVAADRMTALQNLYDNFVNENKKAEDAEKAALELSKTLRNIHESMLKENADFFAGVAGDNAASINRKNKEKLDLFDDQNSASLAFGGGAVGTTKLDAAGQVTIAMAAIAKGKTEAAGLAAALKTAGANLSPEDYKKVEQALGIGKEKTEGMASAFSSLLQGAASLKSIIGGTLGNVAAGGASVFGGIGAMFGGEGGIGSLFKGGASKIMSNIGGTLLPALGAIAGPVIGAISSWFENRKLDKIGKEAGAVLGTSISRETAKAIKETQSSLGVGLGTASLLNLDKVMGGKDPREFASQISSLMSGIKAGTIPAAQGVEQLSKAFSAVADAAAKAGRVGDRTMVGILKNARSMGGDAYTPEMKEFTSGKLDAAQAGLEKFIKGLSKVDGYFGAMGTDSATIFMATFSASLKERGIVATVDAMGPMFETLQKKLKDVNAKGQGDYDQGAGADAILAPFAALQAYLSNDVLRGAVDAVDGLRAVMVNLADAGYLNLNQFTAMENVTAGLFNSMTEGGMDVGTALQVIAPNIQAAIAAAEQFGVPLSDDMQHLKDLAEANGIAFKTDPMERMADALEAIAVGMGYMTKAADTTGAAFSRNFDRTYHTQVEVNTRYTGETPGDGTTGGTNGNTEAPVDFTAASGFYSAKMPRGDHAEGMTYLGVHPGERVSVTPASQNGGGGAQGGGASTIVLQVGREVFGRIVTDLARSGHIQIPDHAVTSNL